MKKSKNAKRIISFMAALLLIVSMAGIVSTPAFAASVNFPTGPIIGYTLNTSGTVTTYQDSSLRTYSGYISCSTDQVTITQIYGTVAGGYYPTSKGQKFAWFNLLSLMSSANPVSVFTATRSITSYSRNTLSSTYGLITAGDHVIVVSNDGYKAQVLDPITGSNSYRLEWIRSSDIPTANVISTPQPNSTQNAVVSWLYAQSGKTLGNGQCVGEINVYLSTFFNGLTTAGHGVSYAYQIWNMSFPSGWTKIPVTSSNFRPLPGDVLVWNSNLGSGAGHTAVVISSNGSSVTSLDQNWSGHYCTVVTHSFANVIGVVRPPFNN